MSEERVVRDWADIPCTWIRKNVEWWAWIMDQMHSLPMCEERVVRDWADIPCTWLDKEVTLTHCLGHFPHPSP